MVRIKHRNRKRGKIIGRGGVHETVRWKSPSVGEVGMELRSTVFVSRLRKDSTHDIEKQNNAAVGLT